MKEYILDTETTTLSPYAQHARLITMGVYSLDRKQYQVWDETDIKSLLIAASYFITSPDVTLIGTNLKFDLFWLCWALGLPKPLCKIFDIQIEASLCVTGHPIGQEALAKQRLGKEPYKIDRKRMREHPLELIRKYQEEDVMTALELYPISVANLTKRKQWPLFNTLCRLSRLLVGVELRGLKLADVQPLIIKETKAVYHYADILTSKYSLNPHGKHFNNKVLSYVKQFEHTDANVYSLRRLTLEKPETKDFVNALLKYRQHSKRLSTYLKPFRDKKIIYPTYRVGRSEIGGSKFGRLSVQDPPIQQLPPKLRTQLFKEPMMQHDYSQIELRIAAFLSRDPVLLRAFQKDRDLHSELLAGIMKMPYAEVMKLKGSSDEWDKKRVMAKGVNFGSLVYGGTEEAVMRILLRNDAVKDYDQTLEEVMEMLDKASQVYKRYLQWFKEVGKQGEKTGWIKAPLGRLLNTARFNERQMASFLVSGMAAEIGHIGACLLDAAGFETSMFIHDATYTPVYPEADVKFIQEIMTHGVINSLKGTWDINFDVPLVVDSKLIGGNE